MRIICSQIFQTNVYGSMIDRTDTHTQVSVLLFDTRLLGILRSLVDKLRILVAEVLKYTSSCTLVHVYNESSHEWQAFSSTGSLKSKFDSLTYHKTFRSILVIATKYCTAAWKCEIHSLSTHFNETHSLQSEDLVGLPSSLPVHSSFDRRRWILVPVESGWVVSDTRVSLNQSGADDERWPVTSFSAVRLALIAKQNSGVEYLLQRHNATVTIAISHSTLPHS